MLLVHVLNPFGMAWLRRFNEHNVDLNRNFLGADEAYEGAPDGYAELDSFLNPPGLPTWELFYPKAGWLILRFGMATLKQTVAGGQYVNPRGMFWGGASLEEGPRMFQRHVQDRLADVTHVVAVDVHTGLGPFGADTLLVCADEGDPVFSRMRETFGDRVSSMDPEHGPAYQVRGAYHAMYRHALPKVKRGLRRPGVWHLQRRPSLGGPSSREPVAPFRRRWDRPPGKAPSEGAVRARGPFVAEGGPGAGPERYRPSIGSADAGRVARSHPPSRSLLLSPSSVVSSLDRSVDVL